MTADPTPEDVDRLRTSLDAATATTPVHPDWDDVLRRADGRGDLALARSTPVGSRRILLAAAGVIAVAALAAGLAIAAGDDGPGARVDVGGPSAAARGGPRWLPQPLPDGWTVTDVSSTEVRLAPHLSGGPFDCPCTVAQWHDGEGHTATYRSSQDLLFEAHQEWQEVVDLGGRANHTLGVCPLCDYAGDIGQTLIWSTSRGRGELTVTGLDTGAPNWFADGPGHDLALAVSGGDGAVVPSVEGWTLVAPPVEVPADAVRETSTTVTLRTDAGGSLYYEAARPGLLRSQLDTGRPDGEARSDPDRPVLVLQPFLQIGAVRPLLAPWVDVDVAALAGDPDDPDAERADQDDLRLLLDRLEPATDEVWAQALADVGLDDPGPAASLDEPLPSWNEGAPTTTAPTTTVPTTEGPASGSDAPARYVPELPAGWTVLSAATSDQELGSTCPCRLAQWSDGTDTISYREQADRPSDAEVDAEGTVDLGGGTTASHDIGARADRGGTPPGDDRLRWATETGFAEIVLSASDGVRLILDAGDGLALARALASSRGSEVPPDSGFTSLAPPVDFTPAQATAATTTVHLRTSSGTLAVLRVTPSGVARWTLTDLVSEDPSAYGPVFTVLEPGASVSSAPGVVPPATTRLVGAWAGADVAASSIGSVEPGRREDALPATADQLGRLLDALRPATEAEWQAFVASVPD